MTTILGISGSLRAGSFNSALLRAAADAMPNGREARDRRASKAFRSTTATSRLRRAAGRRREAQGARRRGRRLAARDARVQQLDSRRVQERDRLAVAAGRGHCARVRRPARRRHRRVAGRIRHAALANRVAAGAEDARHRRVFRRPAASLARGRRVRRRAALSSTSAFASSSRSILRASASSSPRRGARGSFVLGNHDPFRGLPPVRGA